MSPPHGDSYDDDDDDDDSGGGGGGGGKDEEREGRDKEEEERGVSRRRRRRKRRSLLLLGQAGWVGDVVAGAVSGMSLYFLPKAHRKGLALYCFTRSGEFLARVLSSHRLLPTFLHPLVPHIDVVLMALSGASPLVIRLGRWWWWRWRWRWWW